MTLELLKLRQEAEAASAAGGSRTRRTPAIPLPPRGYRALLKDADWETRDCQRGKMKCTRTSSSPVHDSAAPSKELPTITPNPPGGGGGGPSEMNAPGSKAASRVCFCVSEGDRASQIRINPSKSKANNGKMMSPLYCAASAH